MILKTSLFNKGIYKSTLRRFYLGSIAYFILLFMTSCMIIFLNSNSNTYWQESENSYLLSSGILQISVILSVAVPTVVALLIYRFVHSKRSSIFVHSLPVSRTANYISSLLSGFTLMTAPIVLNGLILATMALSGQWPYLAVSDCFVWIGINALTVFIMFSYSGICAMLTGNSFAFVGLNILIHCFIPLIVASFGMFSECFLFGYASNNVILNFVSENNPVMFLSALTLQVGYKYSAIDVSKIVWHIVVAIILYALTLVLYKKRRMETAEDVAAYKCLNPIYKYLLSFMGAIITFAILGNVTVENSAWVLWIVFIVSTVIYFTAEMILKKTFKVWKKAFKGYVAFLSGLAVVFGVFSLTDFFGFESYVPKPENVKSVSAFDYYYQNSIPVTEDSKLIEYVTSKHTELSKAVPENVFAQNATTDEGTRIHLEYTLENGRKVKRVYNVSYDESHRIMSKMYESTNYKKECEEIFGNDIGKIYNIYLSHNPDLAIKSEQYQSLIDCIKKDIEILSYDKLHPDSQCWTFSVTIDYLAKSTTEEYAQKYTNSMHLEINANYKNTISWMHENGYWDRITANYSESDEYYLCTSRALADMLDNIYGDNNVKSYDPSAEKLPNGSIKLDSSKLNEISDFVHTYEPSYIYDEESSYILGRYNEEMGFESMVCIPQETAREFMNKMGVPLP